MSHPVPANPHSRHSYSPSRARYYAPPHHSQHPQMPSMWQPHLHHHPTNHVHHPRNHPIPHPYHMPHSLPRPDDMVRTALPPLERPMYPSDRRDPNEQYAHRHRVSYPPMMHAPVPGPYSSATNWKNAHYEGKSLESSRHEEPRKINFSEMSNTEEAPEVAPITKTDVQKELEPEQTAIQSADKTATSEPVTQIVTVARKEERATPASTVKAAASLEEKFQQTLKSPVTMCFERFLGAAEVLAQKSAMKKVNARDGRENANPTIICPSTGQKTFDDSETPASHRPVRLEDKFHGRKRAADEMEFDEDDTNPFAEIARDRDLQRQVILHMALQRNMGDENGDGLDDVIPPLEAGPQKTVIEDGFYWKEFPACETVLYKHMAEYYGISTVQRQSRMQQSFNKMLVDEVRTAAEDAGIKFDPSFTEKKLRDRIRCFYKTHLQNAKKRLVTLQKRPESLNNQAIVRVYIRCVKSGISFAESLYMEPEDESQPNKRGRLSHVEKAKAALKREEAAAAAAEANSQEQVH
ncbi:hypothetical protein FisN_13Hh255 [Fistulifera solaris]|uniref:Uncharacterized protein n=1 Tax=Fistulifera solaris TaxID=1519565 RepID=A0A1Z5KMU4_FISSO|nr:hypothetical protein FisN_13Hh255 [Fistulifera solaris]|eukprot:GAX27653.1 hypothetical protein FisN_13Hh255 [Fistulifera solaris]